MELELDRIYYPEGTNGEIQHEGQLVCPSIELPWRNNRRSISCIPEGRYEVRKRFTEKRGQHLLIVDIPGRSGILIHPANDAQRELLGCIAPVTTITGPGRGIQSRTANEKLKGLVTAALDRKEQVFITIKLKEQ